MFASLESFSLFFFIGVALISLAILFEDKLIALEEKRIEKKTQKKGKAK